MHSDQILKIELAIKDKVIKTYSFTQDTIDIGRIPTADIFIDNSGISRQHTRIERSIGGPYIVKDMGSTNGTFLNDLQITEAALNDNDLISLGKFSLRITIASEEKQKKIQSEISPDDFDGTTVLSATQLSRLRAGLEKDPPAGTESDSPPSSSLSSDTVSPTSLFLWGGMILVLVIIGFLIFK